MKKRWLELAARIDARNVRERAMIYAAVCGAIFLAVDRGLVEPEMKQRQEVRKAIAQQTDAIVKLERQLLELSRPSATEEAGRQRIEGLNRALAEAERKLSGTQQNLVAPERMSGLLEEMLRRNQRVRLLSLRTLSDPAGAAAGAGAPAAAAWKNGLYNHGLEVVVEGSYADLTAYLEDLEGLPQRMYWSEIAGEVVSYPTTRLRIKLYTLSLDKEWLKM